jgi:hypothetical protein
MKCFSIYPLADLNKELMPTNKQVMVPAGSEIQSHQYANHVYLTVHSRTNQTRTALREIMFAIPFQEIPNDYELIGTIIANEALGLDDDENSDEDSDEESEILEEVPTDPEEFYSVLALINVYISPEMPISARDGKSWSFIKERR